MILPLESLVPSRSTCERMKELGFEQETCFHWVEWITTNRLVEILVRQIDVYALRREEHLIAAAPTAAEIAERLKEWGSVDVSTFDYATWYAELDRFVGETHSVTAKTATEALALLWIKVTEGKAP